MKRWRFELLIVASLAVHGTVVAMTPSATPRPSATEPARAEWVRLSPPPVEPPPAPEPTPEEASPAPELAQAPVRPRRRRRAPEAAPPSAEPPTAAAPAEAPTAPLDFGAVTLSAGSSPTGFAPAGSGSGPARAGRSGGARGAAQPAVSPGPSVVPVANLGRPPRPPELRDALRAAYPSEERREGRRGDALVRVRIAPTGRVGAVAVLQSSTPAFGQACRQVLRGSRWDAPLARNGDPVATIVRYRCRFETR
ncbi:MAG: TonB family protein [Myxococcota bacterium]